MKIFSKSFILLAAFQILGLPSAAAADTSLANSAQQKIITEKTPSQKATIPKNPAFRGWDYLVHKLREDGVSEQQIKEIYKNKRMPRFTPVYFSLSPKESKRIYAGFYSPKKLKAARNFLVKHKKAFDAAEKQFHVSRHVIAAILLIETHFGGYTGRDLVVHRLSRLGSISEPNNLKANLKRLLKDDTEATEEKVHERGEYLEEMFYPEVPALMKIARDRKIDIFHIKGSRAGAFGLPQFLPSTYLKFGTDGNKDGLVSLYHEADAIWSASNFLSSYGWKDDAPLASKRQVVWRYNHSEPYVDAVLGVAARLAQTN